MKIAFKNYPIGFLTGLFDVSADTVRLYAKKGLLEAKTNETNNYRYFYREDVFNMDYIMRLKQIGFSLDDIQQIACALPLEKIEDKIQKRLNEVEQQIESLLEMKEKLHSYATTFEAVLKKNGQIWITEKETTYLLVEIRDSIPGTMEYLSSLDRDLRPFLTFHARNSKFPLITNAEFLDKEKRGDSDVILSCEDVNGISLTEDFPTEGITVVGPCRFACSIGSAYTGIQYEFVHNLEKFIAEKGRACGHFFRHTHLYSFYNLEGLTLRVLF